MRRQAVRQPAGWAPNQDPSSPKAAVAEMEEEMRTMNAKGEAGMEAEMGKMGVPAEKMDPL